MRIVCQFVEHMLRPGANRLSVKALTGPCRTEPTIVTEVGLRKIAIFGTGFYNLIKSEVNTDELKQLKRLNQCVFYTHTDSLLKKDRFAN